MAVFAHNALGEGAVGFALSFAAFQLILTYLWWRTGVHDPEHRPLSQPYCFAYLAYKSAYAGVSPWQQDHDHLSNYNLSVGILKLEWHTTADVALFTYARPRILWS
jgi:hypothetical protein